MAGSGPEPVEILESRGAERRFSTWWRAQSTRRRLVLALGPAALLVLAFLTVDLTRPQPPAPAATAWPAEHAAVTYDGMPAGDPSGRTADFSVSVRNQDAAPLTVVQMTVDYRGLTLHTDPRLPVAVQPGQTVRIQLIATAADCTRIPMDDELPFIDVTFRNIRAIGQESEILGDRYTSDLHRAMTAACRRG
ncbi:hypothetical protein [Streptacidiphilus neutrinimicus]|uniref:hypothetical protein n=1 Tax=Streptacidiphilus neutrinimicus TaxID=105420 RepID=UPI00069384C8|nr:hypothetical protein [Streptacidiphilus neutrinimicus]